jgi:hypothetical protein
MLQDHTPYSSFQPCAFRYEDFICASGSSSCHLHVSTYLKSVCPFSPIISMTFFIEYR